MKNGKGGAQNQVEIVVQYPISQMPKGHYESYKGGKAPIMADQMPGKATSGAGRDIDALLDNDEVTP